MRWIVTGILCAQMLPGADAFVGAMGGVAAISADARTEGSPPQRFSAYKPENGATAIVFGGWHFTDYFSAQASFAWNRHSVVLSQADIAGGTSVDLPVRAAFHTFGVEAMAFFRSRESRLRPYLSAGPTVANIQADAAGTATMRGISAGPRNRIRSIRPGLRVAVGIDWRVTERFALRYSFSETLQRNPLSRALDPMGQRNLANFQNWWGVVWSF